MKHTHTKLVEIAHMMGQQVTSSYPDLDLIIIAFNQTEPTPVALTGQAPNRTYAIRLLRTIADNLEKNPSPSGLTLPT